MTSPIEEVGRHARLVTYILLGSFLVAAMVIGVVVFRAGRANAQADEKADQLTTALVAAGFPAPSKDQIVHVLGDDGGAVCADPNNALNKALMNSPLTNGAAGPGLRPVIGERDLVRAGQIVLSVYCPEELAEFTEYAESLKLEDVAR
jgi:hypothetical protein